MLHGIEDREIREKLVPVIAALENGPLSIELPLAAKKALDEIGHGTH